MPQPEWVEPHLAAHRLAHHWDIPLQIAEQIVRGVLRSNNEVQVRGRGRGLVKGTGFGDTELRLIGREIGATLNPGSLISSEFSDVEMDWSGLLKHSRNLVPPDYEHGVSAAIEKLEVGSGANPATAAAETEMKLWLRQRADDPPGRKADIFKWAKSGELIGEKGKALGRKSFGRAWGQAAPHAWKRPGKRTKVLQLSELKSRDNQIKTPR
jgi:hypothetical protein